MEIQTFKCMHNPYKFKFKLRIGFHVTMHMSMAVLLSMFDNTYGSKSERNTTQRESLLVVL